MRHLIYWTADGQTFTHTCSCSIDTSTEYGSTLQFRSIRLAGGLQAIVMYYEWLTSLRYHQLPLVAPTYRRPVIPSLARDNIVLYIYIYIISGLAAVLAGGLPSEDPMEAMQIAIPNSAVGRNISRSSYVLMWHGVRCPRVLRQVKQLLRTVELCSDPSLGPRPRSQQRMDHVWSQPI